MKRKWALTFIMLVSGCLSAAEPAPEEHTGLKVGDKAPEIKLKDQTNTDRSLTELLKESNVAVVFFRSAGW